jgi:hypothetical protein
MAISSDTLVEFRYLLSIHKDGLASDSQKDRLKELKERFIFEEPDMYRKEIDIYGKPEDYPGCVD